MKKNAIVVLTRGYTNIERYGSLIKRNQSISEKILKDKFDTFDILIFHEGNITKEHQEYINSKTPELSLRFLNIKETGNRLAFNNSKNRTNYGLCAPTMQSNMFPLGYKHMCHFWSIDFIYYLSDYKYVIRIDEDCFVTEYDSNTLTYMNENEIYLTSPYFQEQDDWYVIVGMKNLWDNFVKKMNPTLYGSFEDITCPYTNFIIFDMDYVKSNSVIRNFLHEIDTSNCIYSNRWGDLPIWGMITSTLMDNKHYWENKSIKYFHGSHNKIINN